MACVVHLRVQLRDRVVGTELVLGDLGAALVPGSPVILSAAIPGLAIAVDVRVSLWRARRA